MGKVTIGSIVHISKDIESKYRMGFDGPDYSKPYRVTDTDGDRAIVAPVDGIGKNWIVSYEALTLATK